MRLSVLVGLRALRGNPLRTALSALGVIIGVGALVAVLAMGDGVERFAREEIARSTDLQMILVTPRTSRSIDGLLVRIADYPTFTETDAASLQDSLGPATSVNLGITGGVLARAPGDTVTRGVLVTGVATVPRDLPFTVRQGRLLAAADLEAGNAVAAIPARTARELGIGLGDTVLLGPAPFSVIGLTAAEDSSARVPALVPLSAVGRALAPMPPPPPSVVVRVDAIEDVPAVRTRIESWLAGRWPDWGDRVSVQSNERRADQARRAMLMLKLLMGAITGISLVVGGIGIMNVLLASVTERTREIGVRRATGARRRDVLAQFLAESVAITSAGAAVGVALGLAVGSAVAAVMRAQTEASIHIAVTTSTLAIAAGAALVVGLVFGMYPAVRAARLAPIDAIRHE